MYNQYIILAEAKPGRAQEYDDWYVWVHTHDVMQQRIAAIAAQCFRRTQTDLNHGRVPRYGQKFLCLYENSDPLAMTGTLAYANGEMLISSATDNTAAPGGGYYDTVLQQVKVPGSGPGGAVVLEWIEAAAGIEQYIAQRFAALLSQAAVAAGWVGKVSAHQIFDAARPGYVAVYNLAGPDDAGRIWDGVKLPAQDEVTAACFVPIAPRLTRLALLEADDEARETRRRMREMVLRRERGG